MVHCRGEEGFVYLVLTSFILSNLSDDQRQSGGGGGAGHVTFPREYALQQDSITPHIPHPRHQPLHFKAGKVKSRRHETLLIKAAHGLTKQQIP